MARDSCDTGRTMHRSKRDAEAAADGKPVKRCDRCRQWHVVGEKTKKSQKTQQHRWGW